MMIIKRDKCSKHVQLLSSKLPLLLKDEHNLMVLMGSDTYPEKKKKTNQ